MQQRKIPMRMCLGCGEMKPKKELVRIVKNKENEITVDITGKKPGRGAYICKDKACLEKAVKSKKLNRAFSCEISGEIYSQLQEEMPNE